MGKLLVAEAMPGKLIVLFHIIRGMVIVGCVAFLVFFLRQESRLMEKYLQTKTYQDRMLEYDRIMQEAEDLYTAGNLEESEKLCLQVLADNLTDPDPYIRLSNIYCDNKLYYEALQILESYPEKTENGEISEKKREIEQRIQNIEKSCFTVVE